MANKSYASLADFKARMPGPPPANYDAVFLQILQQASLSVDSVVHRHFETWEGVRYFDGADGNGLNADLIAIDDLLSASEIALDLDSSQSYASVLAATDYRLYANGMNLNGYPKVWLKATAMSHYPDLAPGIDGGIRITGVFGYGDGESATPYMDSGDGIQDNPLTSAARTLTVSNGNLFSPGMTLRVESEQIYVSWVGGASLTVVRGVNGTLPAVHAKNTPIYIYRYPEDVAEAVILQANRDWQRRLSPTQATIDNPITGSIPVFKGLDPDIAQKLNAYVIRYK